MLSTFETNKVTAQSTRVTCRSGLGFSSQRPCVLIPKKSSSLEDFLTQTEEECVQGSAIAPSLYAPAIKVVADIEVLPGGEVDYPIHQALNWKLTRFGHQAKENLYAALFQNEDGSIWQAKLSRSLQKGKKPYQAPVANGSRAFLPPIPLEVRKRISDRYGVEVPTERSFWDWLENHPGIPIIYTEGGKKALSLLSLGYVAIALYGVNSGYRSKDEWGNKTTPYLISDVARFVGDGRQSILAFDEDEKPETKRRVDIALSRFGGLLSAGGEVKVVQWDGAKGKGADDLIVAKGASAWEAAHDQALPLNHWSIWQRLNDRLTYTAAVKLRTIDLSPVKPKRWHPALRLQFLRLTGRDLCNLLGDSLPESGLIAISSPKGTGKTNFLNSVVSSTERVLLAGHRIALMRNLSERLGIDYRGDLDKVNGKFINGSSYTLRIGFCVDSLLSIDPETFRGCDLVLDEVVQVVRHLLTSSTCAKDGKRPALLARFADLVRIARRVIVADADLNDATLHYLTQLRPEEMPVFLIRNDVQSVGYPVLAIHSPDRTAIEGQIIADLKALEIGKTLIVTLDNLRAAKTLARLIEHECPGKRILQINSKTSGGEAQKAMILRPNEEIPKCQYDIIICTPSIATGVSMETQGIIAKVYGIFTGVSSNDADMAQALGRVREPVPRVVWCAARGSNFCKISRSANALEIKTHLLQRTSATVSLIRSNLKQDAVGLVESYDWQSDPHVNLFAQISAEQNRSMFALRDSLLVRLRFEGNQVTVEDRTSNPAIRVLMKQCRDEIKQIDAEALVAAKVLTHIEVAELQSKEGISPEEQAAIERYYLVEFYCIQPEALTVEDVLADKEGRRRGELLNLEAQLHPGLAVDRTARALEKQASWNQGICPWDISGSELRRLLREQIGVNEIIDRLKAGGELTPDDYAIYAARARAQPLQIKVILHLQIANLGDTQIINSLLAQLGIKTKRGWSTSLPGREGIKTKVYRLVVKHWQATMDVLTRRNARRESYEQIHGDCGSPLTSITKNQTGDPIQEATPNTDKWLSSDSLIEIREQWMSAESEEEREALRQVIPISVLESAIA